MPDTYQQETSSLFFHTIQSYSMLFASIGVLCGVPLCPVLVNPSVVIGQYCSCPKYIHDHTVHLCCLGRINITNTEKIKKKVQDKGPPMMLHLCQQHGYWSQVHDFGEAFYKMYALLKNSGFEITSIYVRS